MIHEQNIGAYTAGYLDGDGCFYVGKFLQKPKLVTIYEYSIQVVSVKRIVLDKFKEIFGGSIRKKPEKMRHKSAYCWTIKGKRAYFLAQNVYPFVIDKRIQCACFIQFSKLIERNNFETVEASIINQREDLINSIRMDKHMSNFILTKEEVAQAVSDKLTITPQEIDYPYLAGLIDAEGCFRIKKWKPKNRPNIVYSITVEIGNTKLPIIPWLTKRFGGSATFIPAKGIKKASATWTLSAAALYEILPKIRPFLINKKDVCDKLIEFQNTILPNGGDRHSELFRALFEKRREVRERIIEEIHKLNLKGSR